MTDIATNLNTIDDSLSDIKTSIVNKGGTVSGNITTFATAIDNIPSGGGSSGKYQLLERVKDDNNVEIGTVSGFFTDANNVEYAVVCLDAQYRQDEVGNWTSDNGVVTNLPADFNLALWSTKETATSNTQKILDWCSANNYTSDACSFCRTHSFVIDGVTYYGQLPNIVELVGIFIHREEINTLNNDPDHWMIPENEGALSSNQNSADKCWIAGEGGGMMTYNKQTGNYDALPVLEIPNATS